MTKPTILALAAALTLTGSAAAQSKMDLRGRALMRQAQIEAKHQPAARMVRGANKAKAAADARLRAFMTLNPGFTPDDIAEIPGLEIQGGRDTRLMAQFPVEAVAALEESPAVKSIRLERPVDAKMNLVRRLSGIDLIHQGEALPRPYTGKGVICALVDGGFDPNHVNFLNEDGSNRIENFTYFRALSNGNVNPETYDASYMPNIDTESSETFHGTHTMGIMAGSYRGKVKAGILDTDANGFATADVQEIDNPYYGVAPDAGIAAAAGAATDYYVALGIDQILNYAYWKAGETKSPVPVCLNLSLGSNIGPHDGSATLSRFIDEEAGNASPLVPFIPVVSAGNEGDLPIALNKTFTEVDTEMKTILKSLDLYAGTGKYPDALYGQVYLYSDSDEPFEVQAIMYNKSRGAVALQNALGAAPEGAAKYLCTSAEYINDSETDKVSPQLAKNFEGYLGVMAYDDVDESQRYMAIVDMMLWQTDANLDGNYCIGVLVKGKPGQRIDAYCNGEWFNFSSDGMADNGFLDGMTDGTISDVACGKNVIVVGSYNARNYWANVDGSVAGYEGDMFSNNKVSDFTSYGTLADGRTLPHVCAPGATVISSSNEYYIQDNRVADDQLQATFTDGDRRYSWHQCVGTSMATPVVTGSIALWMQADPTLTVEEIREIIARTATVDDDVRAGNPIQWGAGKFNAYEGLKEVLSRQASINGVGADKASELLVSRNGDHVEVTLPGATDMEVRIYAANGSTAGCVSAPGNTASISMAGLPKGVYIINVNGLRSSKLVK